MFGFGSDLPSKITVLLTLGGWGPAQLTGYSIFIFHCKMNCLRRISPSDHPIIIIINTWGALARMLLEAAGTGCGAPGAEELWGCGGSGGPGPQGCDERGGAGTLTCGNGPGNSFFTETALLDEVHSSRSRFWCGRIALACGNGARKQISGSDNDNAMASEPGAPPTPPASTPRRGYVR